MTHKPFAAADKSKRRMKVLLTGAPKSGKTRAALTFPRPALIDSEGGWEYIEDLTPVTCATPTKRAPSSPTGARRG